MPITSAIHLVATLAPTLALILSLTLALILTLTLSLLTVRLLVEVLEASVAGVIGTMDWSISLRDGTGKP